MHSVFQDRSPERTCLLARNILTPPKGGCSSSNLANANLVIGLPNLQHSTPLPFLRTVPPWDLRSCTLLLKSSDQTTLPHIPSRVRSGFRGCKIFLEDVIYEIARAVDDGRCSLAIHTYFPSSCDRQFLSGPTRRLTSPAALDRYTLPHFIKPSRDMRASITFLAMTLSLTTAAVVQRSSNTGRSPVAQPGAVIARQNPVPSASPVVASIPANGTVTSDISPEITPDTSSIPPEATPVTSSVSSEVSPVTTSMSSEITPIPILAVAKPGCTPKSICVDKMNYACMKRYGA